ncbi:uncharacterized protein M6B38_290965 [Iris pallida]|uniref:Uncharacterized protein n=1 Tax=Iris pallida TaxID=29817 RepID=A0AAX6HVB4_IRIPA|nr:uncharacterized protein M6B38_290965 [Iris pallida]
MTESSGGSSLLAMLVPSLMQLSKSRDSRVQEKSSSDERGSLKYQGETKAAQIISLNMEGQEAYSSCMSPDQSLGSVQEPIEVNSEKIQLETSQKVPESNQIPNSSIDQHVNSGYDCLEKLLGELISRVGRVEAFFSRFEENMMKPLSRMDTRLQQVECKLDALAVRSQCSEQFPPRVSSPEVLHEESDSVNRLSNTEGKEASEDTTADTVLPTDGMASLSPEYETRPGLIFKAPDFSVDDDDCVDTDSTLDTLKDSPAKNKVMSIDAMLTSSLAAFLTSNTVISPNTTSSLRASSQASIDVTKRAFDTSKDVVLEDDECNMSDAKRKGICSDESKLVVDYAAAPGEKFNESDMKNRGYDTLNTSRKDTTLDASLLVINRDVECPVSSFQFSCGLKVMAPEYPKEGESSKVETTSNLVESNMLPHKVDSEVNKENDMKVKVYLDQIRNILPRKVRCEKRDHDDVKWKYSTQDVEACDGGCGSNCSSHEGVFTQKDCDVALNEQQQTHVIDGVVTQNLTGSSADIGLTQGATQKRLCEPIVKSTNDNSSISSLDETFPEDKADSERSVGGRTISFRGDFTTNFASFSDSDSEQSIALSGLVSNWVDDCSCNSSVDEHFLKNKFDILQLDSSTDSSGGDFRTVDHSKWQAAGSDYESVLPVLAGEDNIINRNHFVANAYQSRESCSKEKSNANLEQELSSSMLDFDDFYDLKFAPGKSWAGLPLEVLLGEMSDANQQAAAGESGEDDCTKNGQQQEELSSSGGTNCKADADNRLLVDLEGPALLTEDELKAFNNLPLFTDFPDLI